MHSSKIKRLSFLFVLQQYAVNIIIKTSEVKASTGCSLKTDLENKFTESRVGFPKISCRDMMRFIDW